MWEISYLLRELDKFVSKKSISTKHLTEKIYDMINLNYGKFKHYALFKKNIVLLFKEIYSICINKKRFDFVDLKSLIITKIYENMALLEELNSLVSLNYLAFDPVDSSYQLQGKSMFYGLEKFVERFSEDILNSMAE